jgi:hypothetical protein
MKTNKYLVAYMFICLLFIVSSCTFFRIIRYRDSEISYYQIFPYRALQASSSPFRFLNDPVKNSIPQEISYSGHANVSLRTVLESTQTVAFIVLQGNGI